MNWKDHFIYEDGHLTRANRHPQDQHKHVGSINNSGYLQTELLNRTYMVHRIIYEMHHGKIADGLQIDHIDRNRTNNRVENLRAVTQSQNQLNTSLRKNNTTGTRGVFRLSSGRFRATLRFNKKRIELGRFDTYEEASKYVETYIKKLHGEFAVII